MLNPRRRYLRTDQIKRAQTLTKTRSWEGSVVAQRAGIVPGLVRLELRRDPARRTRRPLSTSGCRLLRFLEGFEPFLEFGHSTIEWINRTQLPRDIIEPTAQPLSHLSDQTLRKPDNPPKRPLPPIRELSNEIPVPGVWALGLSHTRTIRHVVSEGPNADDRTKRPADQAAKTAAVTPGRGASPANLASPYRQASRARCRRPPAAYSPLV